MIEKANKLARSEHFDYAEQIGQWNGADVFVAVDKDGGDIGLPQYILALQGKVRWATVDETKAIMSAGII